MTFALHPDLSVAGTMGPALQPSRRGDGWTADRQAAFCDAVAAGANIANAARSVGLSPSSAYAFRNSAKGAAFAIGWTAAQLLQRQRLSDEVAARAFEGQTVTITRPDGTTHERHFYDNRLAMNVLARLDRLAAGQVAAGLPDVSGEGQAARLAAAEFDRYLAVLTEGGGPARAGLFLAARTADAARPGAPELAALSALARADLFDRTGAGVVAELDVADLDPAARAGWTAEQWARAEAAGLVALAPPKVSLDSDGGAPHSPHSHEELEPVWWDEDAREWRTDLPPPEGETPSYEAGDYVDEDYERGLTDSEQALMDRAGALELAGQRAADSATRERWFTELREWVAAAEAAAAATSTAPAVDKRTSRGRPGRPQAASDDAEFTSAPAWLDKGEPDERTTPAHAEQPKAAAVEPGISPQQSDTPPWTSGN